MVHLLAVLVHLLETVDGLFSLASTCTYCSSGVAASVIWITVNGGIGWSAF
jgi:hypothetical protein